MNLAITIDFQSQISLQRQIYSEIRKLIMQGLLKPSDRLPSTRNLSESLGVSRITVSEAYDQLNSEGYLYSRECSGTFVAKELPEHLNIPKLDSRQTNKSTAFDRLSAYGSTIARAESFMVCASTGIIDFRYGAAIFAGTSLKIWRRLVTKYLDDERLTDYMDEMPGYAPLRAAISDYIQQFRGVNCRPEQLVIVNGSQQAIYLVTRLLLEPGDRVGFEDPGYLGARRIFEADGLNLVPIPTDRKGLCLANLSKTSRLRCVYTTPSHQFPTGYTLSLRRRFELIDWAEKHNAFVIEDDYDSEFRYGERPLPALQGLRPSTPVVYVGTFSKVMFPSLRLGYLVLPEHLVDVFSRGRWLMDRQSSLLEQLALCEFIGDGHLERHIRRMRILYKEQRQVLIESLIRGFGRRVEILGDAAGMHVLIELQTKYNDRQLLERAIKAGVNMVNAKLYYSGAAPSGRWVLGFSNLTSGEIEEGVRRLSSAASW